MENIYESIIIPDSDLGQMISLYRVLDRLFQTRVNYFLKQSEKHKNYFVAIQFNKASDQVRVLKKIIHLLNKGEVPSDQILNQIPQVWIIPLDMFLEQRVRSGHRDHDQLKEQFTWLQTKKERLIAWITSPMDASEDATKYLCHCECGSLTEPVPDGVKISSQRDNLVNFMGDELKVWQNIFDQVEVPADFKLPPEEVEKIWQTVNRRVCGHCRAEGVRKRCGGCGTSYCNLDCQKANFPTHKKLCKILKVFKMSLSEERCQL